VPASLLDTSAWVAAVFPRHPFHSNVQSVLQAASAEDPAVFCRATEISFLRVLTTSAVLRLYDAEHMTNRDAVAQFRLLMSRPEITEFDEAPGTTALWQQLATRDTAAPKVWMDAYLAAFAITAGLRFVTLDRDFEPYEAGGLELMLLNP
jgi:uncharacterized protein